jgi:hypothetical protein
MSHFQKNASALRLSCVCFPSWVSIKQVHVVQSVPLPMAFTAICRLHTGSLDKLILTQLRTQFLNILANGPSLRRTAKCLWKEMLNYEIW